MKELKEQKTKEQGPQENEVKEVYQKLETKVLDVKAEKGYASSAVEGPLEAPQWKEGVW